MAWEAFVRQLQGRMFALAYSYAGDREDARDLAQDIFVRLYEARSQWPAGDEFLPWLFRVARNRSVDLPAPAERAAAGRRPSTRPRLPTSRTPRPAPRRRPSTSDRRSLLHAALRGLSAINREIVVLRDVHGLPIQQVASILGIPLGTVKSRASRARVELTERVLALSRGRGDDMSGITCDQIRAAVLDPGACAGRLGAPAGSRRRTSGSARRARTGWTTFAAGEQAWAAEPADDFAAQVIARTAGVEAVLRDLPLLAEMDPGAGIHRARPAGDVEEARARRAGAPASPARGGPWCAGRGSPGKRPTWPPSAGCSSSATRSAPSSGARRTSAPSRGNAWRRP